MLLEMLDVVMPQTGDIRRSMAANATRTVLMAPPQPVCGGEVRQMVWATDGGYLVLLRETQRNPLLGTAVPARSELLVWGRKSGRSRTLMAFDPDAVKVESIEAMGGSDRLLMTTTERVVDASGPATFSRIVLVSATSGASTPISLARVERGGPLIDAYASSDRPVGLLERIDDRTKRIRAFGPDGRLRPELTIERLSTIQFDPQGRGRQLSRVADPATGKGRAMTRSFDVLTGKAGAWQPYKPFPEPEPGLIAVFEAFGLVAKNVRAPSLFLAVKDGKDDESGVISTDGTAAMLSPKSDAVAYVDGGMAIVRTLTTLDRKAYDDALRAQAISEAVRRAKQVGTGLMIYASDNDDALPPNDGDINAKIAPYLKNDALLQGFVYTFRGGSLVEIDRPADTEVGYVDGPGGRAVIYSDSHVKWIANPP